MNTDRTKEVILEMANDLRAYADRIEYKAKELEETKDFTVCGEVVNSLLNMMLNLRLDLMVNRPVRELQKHISNKDA